MCKCDLCYNIGTIKRRLYEFIKRGIFMILADKIIRLRKKNGWSQEELADKMNVSRQAVSKWESAQSIPDLEKILQLSKLFCVTTDYLLKDDIEDEEFTEFIRNLLMLIFWQVRTNLVNGIKQPDGTVKALTVRQVADLLGHSTTQVTEMYYVKKDNKMLGGITDGFCL